MTDRLQRLHEVCRRFRVASLYAFGSRSKAALAFVASDAVAMDDSSSDLDVAVSLQPATTLSARDRVRLTLELEELFGVARVDLTILAEAKVFLAADVVRGELLCCDDPDRQAREELYFLRRAGDLAFFQRERQEGLLSGALRT